MWRLMHEEIPWAWDMPFSSSFITLPCAICSAILVLTKVRSYEEIRIISWLTHQTPRKGLKLSWKSVYLHQVNPSVRRSTPESFLCSLPWHSPYDIWLHNHSRPRVMLNKSIINDYWTAYKQLLVQDSKDYWFRRQTAIRSHTEQLLNWERTTIGFTLAPITSPLPRKDATCTLMRQPIKSNVPTRSLGCGWGRVFIVS